MRLVSVFLAASLACVSGMAVAQDAPAPTSDAAPKEGAKPGADDGAKKSPETAAPKQPGKLDVSVPTYPNPTCPIMGKPISDILYTEVEQGRIYLCCPPCAKKVKVDPKRAYDAAYPTTKAAGNKVCPVTGKALKADAPTVLMQGITFGLCSECCKDTVKANPQVALVKAMDPGVTDVANLKCPITGEPVAKNVFCLVGKDLVRLSTPACVDEVKKDPAAALKKAKDDAAKAKKAAGGPGR